MPTPEQIRQQEREMAKERLKAQLQGNAITLLSTVFNR